MQNGHDPAPLAPQPMQINPQEAAAFALEFLERANHTRAERPRFDIAQALLTAIMRGQAVIEAPKPVPMPAPAPAPAPIPPTPSPANE